MNLNPRMLADIALQLMAAAAVKADDENLERATAARLMLKGIKSGELMVVPTPQDKAIEVSPKVAEAVHTAVVAAAANLEDAQA